jgi:hypothetical protein
VVVIALRGFPQFGHVAYNYFYEKHAKTHDNIQKTKNNYTLEGYTLLMPPVTHN